MMLNFFFFLTLSVDIFSEDSSEGWSRASSKKGLFLSLP